MDKNPEWETRHDVTSSKRGNRTTKNTKRIVLLIILGLLVVFSLTLKATTYIENPGFCKQCHSMRFHYNTWADSTHNSVSCYACHIGYTPVKKVENIPVPNKRYWALKFGDKSYNVSDYMNQVKRAVAAINKRVEQINRQFNFASARFQDLKKFFSLASNTMGQSDIAPLWGNCLSCHQDLGSKSKTDSTGHYKHLQVGLTCDQCHRNVVHGKVSTMSRSECIGCHKKPLSWPPSHKTSDFRVQHGKSYLKRNSCTLCHVRGSQEKVCMDCHGIIMPHPKNFPSIHIQSIKSTGVKQCMKCHQANSNKGTQKRDSTVTCGKCHGEGLPHKRNGKTIATHGKLAVNKGVPSCLNCHKSQDCFSCHGLEMPHPKGFVGQHTQSISNLGIETCAKCHSKSSATVKLCNDCHGMAMPHPEGWKAGHGADASKCAKCHSPSNPANPKAPWARKDFCNSCHGIKDHAEKHWELSGDRDYCMKCHSQATCDKCH